MSSDDEEYYRYEVPLESNSDADGLAYDPTYGDDILVARYRASTFILVQDEAIPHFHRDSVNVVVEEVDPSDYE